MKNWVLLLLFSILSLTILAQNKEEKLDIVYLKNGDILKGSVIDNQTDYLMMISKVLGMLRISYKDIKAIQLIDQAKQKSIKGKMKIQKKKDPTSARMYFSLAPGFGYSYGGIGLRLQQSFINKKAGFAYYIALGYTKFLKTEYVFIPDNNSINPEFEYHYESIPALGGSIGVKLMILRVFYLSQSLFINQLDRHPKVSVNVMAGVDFFVFKSFGFNIGAGLTSNNDPSSILSHDNFAFDMALIYKFDFKSKKLRKENK